MKKIVYSIVMFLVCCFTFSSCALFNINTSSENWDDYEGRYTPHPDFVTQYTSEEHVERISARTEELFEEELKNGTLVDIQVEILYAFYDDDPEYFLITLEYAEEMDFEFNDGCGLYLQGSTKYKYVIGTIRTGEEYYIRAKGFEFGEGPYAHCGLEYSKKYYGCYRLGVQVGNDIIELCDCLPCCNGMDGGHKIDQRIIPPEEYEDLMHTPYWVFLKEY